MLKRKPFSEQSLSIQAFFGAHLKKLRLQSGPSQEAFADKCGLDRTYISGIERGFRNPTLEVIYVLAKGLNVDIKKLFYRKYGSVSFIDSMELVPAITTNNDGGFHFTTPMHLHYPHSFRFLMFFSHCQRQIKGRGNHPEQMGLRCRRPPAEAPRGPPGQQQRALPL